MKQLMTVTKYLVITLLSLTTTVYSADEKKTLENLLNDFLTGQTKAHHQRFWADDLVYTSSSGTRFDKAFIMKGFESSTESSDSAEEDETRVTYSAADIDIRLYDDTAIVAFKLVASENGEVTQTYWNTGTFAKRDIGWQAIAWQATKIPE